MIRLTEIKGEIIMARMNECERERKRQIYRDVERNEEIYRYLRYLERKRDREREGEKVNSDIVIISKLQQWRYLLLSYSADLKSIKL